MVTNSNRLIPQVPSRPGIGLFLLAGLISGVAGALVGSGVAQILQATTGLSFPELSPFSISLASVVPNLLGALVYCALVRRTQRPVRWFGLIALLLAGLDTLMVTMNPPHAHFGIIATPLHFVVAVIPIVLLPVLTRPRP